MHHVHRAFWAWCRDAGGIQRLVKLLGDKCRCASRLDIAWCLAAWLQPMQAKVEPTFARQMVAAGVRVRVCVTCVCTQHLCTLS